MFVSPGALGVFWGTALGKAGAAPGWLPPAALVLCGILFPAIDTALRGALASGNPPADLSLDRDGRRALACCFLVVVLRSGAGLAFPWKKGGWAAAAACAAALGKAAGGFLGDALGVRKAAVLSLGLSALLFCFSGVPAAGVAALFFFQMTTPLTLWRAASLLPSARGLAFGMLAFALFLGFLPGFFGVSGEGGAWRALSAALSLGLPLAGLRKGGER